MRNITIAIVILLITTFNAEGQRFGIKGGLDILNANYSYNGDHQKANGQMGFHVGMVIEFKLSNAFALGTGLIFSEKGFQEDYLIPDEDKTTFFYIDIPALLIYKIPTASNHLYFYTGPYLGLGLFTNLTGQNFNMESGFGSEPEQYLKYDLGLKLGGGIELDVWRFGLSYNMGLLDIRNAIDTSVKNIVLGIDVAYMFGGR